MKYFLALLRVLEALVLIADKLRAMKHREEGRAEVRDAVAEKQAQTKEAADAVMAEGRTTADTLGRLRDGTF